MLANQDSAGVVAEIREEDGGRTLGEYRLAAVPAAGHLVTFFTSIDLEQFEVVAVEHRPVLASPKTAVEQSEANTGPGLLLYVRLRKRDHL